jgi:Protein of unknown function (DUF2958)
LCRYSRRPPLIERDLYFKAAHPLSVYTRAASGKHRITESAADLEAAKGADR